MLDCADSPVVQPSGVAARVRGVRARRHRVSRCHPRLDDAAVRQGPRRARGGVEKPRSSRCSRGDRTVGHCGSRRQRAIGRREPRSARHRPARSVILSACWIIETRRRGRQR
jgi:hypothetical protein